MSRRSVVAFAAAAIVAALATVGGQPLLRAAGHALIWKDPIQPVDVVVVPGWGSYHSLLDAIDLIRDKKAARVAMLTIPLDAAEREIERRGYGVDDLPTRMKILLREGGVTDDQMVDISARVGGTADEIKQLARPRRGIVHRVFILERVSVNPCETLNQVQFAGGPIPAAARLEIRGLDASIRPEEMQSTPGKM